MSSIGKKRRLQRTGTSSKLSTHRPFSPANIPLPSFHVNIDKSLHAIGMFDSGLGGLTVMREIINLLPKEPIIYLGDTARIPYGSKSQETIIRYSIENAIFLMEKNIKLMIVACNTATAYSLDRLKKIFNIPVIGVIQPGVKRALKVTKNHKIAILGTKGTIDSGCYQNEILFHQPNAQLFPISCPLFVPLVEEHFIDHPISEMVIKEYLAPLKGSGIDTLLLGCTHYPMLCEAIQREVGQDVTIVDSATTCAEEVAALLKMQRLEVSPSTNFPIHQFFVSDDPKKFQRQGEAFLGMPIPHVDVITTQY